MTSFLRFSALSRLGDGLFRVVWFGNVIGTNKVDRVIVVFSPCEINFATGELACDLSKRFPVSIPVAYLNEFRIGDLWRGGSWTGKSDNQSLETFELEISEQSVSVMPIGSPLNGAQGVPRYILPFDQFMGHKEHTGSQCARIALPDDSQLVIPCVELIRFYFGASGSFLKRLFSGVFALDRLYTNARLNPQSLVGSIDLASDLAGVAAATVARIAFDSQARSAARWIVNSNVAASVNSVSYYPKTTFPFFGKTELTAHGRWISNGTERIFLAEKIAKCTHPFPFDSLFYTTSKTLKEASAVLRSANCGENPSDNSPGTLEPHLQLTDGSISSVLQNVKLGITEESETCFPDLALKRIRRVKCKSNPTAITRNDSSPDELGAGHDTSTSKIRGAEVSANDQEIFLDGTPPPDAAEVFERAVGWNQAASANYMTWLSLDDSHTEAPKNAFTPGNMVLQGCTVAALENIWAGLLKVTKRGDASLILVLVRDNLTEDAADHICLVRLDSEDVTAQIEKYCLAFSTRNPSDEFDRQVLRILESRQALSLHSLLRNLSMLPI